MLSARKLPWNIDNGKLCLCKDKQKKGNNVRCFPVACHENKETNMMYYVKQSITSAIKPSTLALSCFTFIIPPKSRNNKVALMQNPVLY